MNIQTTRIDGKLDRKACNVVNIYVDKEQKKSKTLTDLASGSLTSFATKQTWDAFKASNSFTRDDYIEKLTEYGVSKNEAPRAADYIMDSVNTFWTRPLLVAVSATGAAYAVLEVAGTVPGTWLANWSRPKKLAVSLIFGAFITGLYVVLRQQGYFT